MSSVPENDAPELSSAEHIDHWTEIFVRLSDLRGDSREVYAAEVAAAERIKAAGVGEHVYEWMCDGTLMMGRARLAWLLPIILKRAGNA